jgi:HEAT repeat protein
MENVRPRDGVAHLTPLLDAEEDSARARVVALLAGYGPGAISAVRKLLKDGPRRRHFAIIDLSAQVRSGPALDLLYDAMASDDFDMNRAACDALIAIVPGLDQRSRQDLYKRTERLFAGAKGHRTVLVAAAKMFGSIGNPGARKTLFKMLDAREPHVVRTHALNAMTQCLRGQKLAANEVDTLVGLLDSDDENGVIRPVVRLLEDQKLDKKYLSTLNELAESPQPLVKRFAVQKLGNFDSGGVVKTLMGYLTDDSYARRDQATASLKTIPGARLPLMKELLACDDERKAFTLAEVLLAHDRDWRRDARNALWKKMESALEKREDRLYAAHHHFLHTLDPDWTAGKVRERAEHLRKARKYPLSAKWLTLLKDSPAFDDDAKLAYAVAEMKSHRRLPAGMVRRHDPALDTLKQLAASAFPLGDRLRRERALDAEDLHGIAFALAEGRSEERSVARELLEFLANKHGRTKVGKAAKNKLKLLGVA